MSVINKLNYLNQTKGLIKTGLNQFGASITDNDTFRSYVTKINNIYTNWPKVTGSGTDLELTPIKKAKMVVDLKGNSSQDGTPTPSTPYPVKVVTGENSLVIQNKNLLDYSTIVKGRLDNGVLSGGSYVTTYEYTDNSFTFTTSMNWYGVVSDWITVDGGMAYYFKYNTDKETNTIPIIISEYDDNKAFIREDSTYSSRSFTMSSNCSYIRIWFTLPNKGTITYSNVSVTKGSTAPTSYVAHQEQNYSISLGNIELCKIGNYQDYIYKSGDNWYKKQLINNIVLDGTNVVFTYQDQSTFPNCLMIPSSSRPRGLSDLTSLRCTHFSDFKSGVGAVLNALYWGNTTQMWLCKDGFSSLEAGNAWLQSQYNNNSPVIVYYPLETPTDIQITDTTLIEQLNNIYNNAYSYNGTTNITTTYASGNEQMVIEAEALMKGGN